MSMKITPENWTFCHYSRPGADSSKRAMITFGAVPDILEDKFVYYLTVMDQDDELLYQEEFYDLSQACHALNAKYQDLWDLVDATKKSSKGAGGCDSCVAH